ncbi:MAG: UbiA family prenyltransferase [Candidatus Aminicenantales bacterium]
MNQLSENQPSFLRKWVVAGRPWALPASAMPVVFGTSLAVVLGGARPNAAGFLLALAAMTILHTAGNMLSDVFDFKRGLDTEVTPVSGALVRGWLAPRQLAAGSAILFIAGSSLGLVLAAMTGPVLLFIGAAGIAVGASYSFLKARGLGDLVVIVDFGILGTLGAWVVQTREFSLLPMCWAVPQAMLVAAILHANNWRDTASDSRLKVRTAAFFLGDKGSAVYYGILIFGSMILSLLFVIIPRVIDLGIPPWPPTFLLILAALPKAIRLWRRARSRKTSGDPGDFILLDGATADYNLIFGTLAAAALWLDVFIRLRAFAP